MKPGEKLTTIQKIGAPLAVIAGFVAICAVIYTLYNMPKALYAADVKTFKREKKWTFTSKAMPLKKSFITR